MKNTKNILIEKLHAFENHPYKVQDNEEMERLSKPDLHSAMIDSRLNLLFVKAALASDY